MTFTKFLKILIASISAALLIFSNHIIVTALENGGETQLIPKDLQQSTDGAVLNYTSEDSNGIKVSINTEKLQKKYYTSLLYEKLDADWSKYGMMSFQLENISENELRLNFLVIQDNSTSLVVKNNRYVMVEKDNSNLIEMINIDNGTIAFEKGFKGKVYIPFKNLGKENESENKEYTVSRIVSWGIIATAAENEVKGFTIKNLSLIDKQKKVSEADNIEISLSGDNEVEMPVVGEAIYQYAVKANGLQGKMQDKKIKFQLNDDVQGVAISGDGKLTIKSDAEIEKIRIYAIINDNLSVSKEIRLLKSWTLSAKEIDGTSKSIPSPYEVGTLMKSNTKLLLNNYVLNLIRIVLLSAAVAFGLLFLKWRAKSG